MINMLEQLNNGSYFIYQIIDGGFGIVRANDVNEATSKVVSSYNEHGQPELEERDVDIYGIRDYGSYFNDDVFELGMEIVF